jgi:radical SAM protein with 4Fe4S-binding SPASM domain
MKRPCKFLWKSPQISWDGNVTVCCSDIDFLLSLGNINENSLEELWNNNNAKKYRLMHVLGEFDKTPKTREGNPICLNCHSHIEMTDEEVIDYLKEINREDLIDSYLELVNKLI